MSTHYKHAIKLMGRHLLQIPHQRLYFVLFLMNETATWLFFNCMNGNIQLIFYLQKMRLEEIFIFPYFYTVMHA